MQALLTNFIYSKRTEATFAKGQQALIQLRDENKRLVTELAEATATLDKAFEIVASANDSLRKLEGLKKTRDGEEAKLREESLKKSASCVEAWKAL